MSIQEIREKIQRRNTIESQLNFLEKQCRALKDQKYELKTILEKEEKEVEKLRKLSWNAIYLTIIGDKEARLEKEQQDVFVAMAKYQSVANEVAEIEKKIESLRLEYWAGKTLETELERAVTQRALELKNSHSEAAGEILKIEEEIAVCYAQLKEIKEAIDAGMRAKRTAESVESTLKSAGNWGIYDVVGGGFVADMVKHEKIQTSQTQMNRLQSDLRAFKTELADIKIDSNADMTISGSLKFADIFFDNIFSDWMVLDKINNSQRQIRETKSSIESTLRKLRDMESAMNGRINGKKNELEQIVK